MLHFLIHLQASLVLLANPQLARINELYNLLSNSSSSDYLKRGEEPMLEGLTPTLDLSLFREAQERTRGTLVCMFIILFTLSSVNKKLTHNFAKTRLNYYDRRESLQLVAYRSIYACIVHHKY